MMEGAGPTRGGSAVEIEVDEVEDEDRDVEYLGADDAVRYVAGWRHANDELDIDEVDGGVSSGPEGEGRVAFVAITSGLSRSGVLVHEPSVEFDALVAVTPATVAATYRLDDREYRMAVPV